MDVVDTVVGAGRAGLAVSGLLSQRGVTHPVLERGQVGESWRSQGWDSFALNTALVEPAPRSWHGAWPRRVRSTQRPRREDRKSLGGAVHLCVSRVARIPRGYRGRDIVFWWHDMGFFDVAVSGLPNPEVQ